MNAQVLRDNLAALLGHAVDNWQKPDYLLIDPATWHILVGGDMKHSMESPASGINMSGDCFYSGYPVIFVHKAGVQLGYVNPRRIR